MPANGGDINSEEVNDLIIEGGLIFPSPTPSSHYSLGKFYSTKLKAESDSELRKILHESQKAGFQTGSGWAVRVQLAGGTAPEISTIDSRELDALLSPTWCRAFALQRMKFSRARGINTLFRTEWSAYRFRRSLVSENLFLTDRILNEFFFLHYFRIHCMRFGISPTDDALKVYQDEIQIKNLTKNPGAIHFEAMKKLYGKRNRQSPDD